MFVKKYYNFLHYLDSLDKSEIYFLGDRHEEYEANNYGYVKGREDFFETMKSEVCNATFAYFPELKSKEAILKPKCEKILEGDNILWLYEHLFDIILKFYENKKFEHKAEAWSYKKIKTEEEIEEEIQYYMKEYNTAELDFLEYMRKDIYNSEKNSNHFHYYQQVVHKAILRCVTKIFKEIPEMSSEIIRYINYITFIEARSLEFYLFETIAKDVVRPYKV